MIDFAMRRLREEMPEPLVQLLSPDAGLVPMPRSAPFRPGEADVLWVPRRICEALVAAGFGGSVLPCLTRTRAVQKSAYAAPGERPSLITHYRSLQADHVLAAPERLVIVDDVITKGATALAAASRVVEEIPDADVRVFALVRTCGFVPDVERILDPVVGEVSSGPGGLRREP
jgi:hypothetical protein